MRKHSLVHASGVAAVFIVAVIIGQPAPSKAQSSGVTAPERVMRHSRNRHDDRNAVREGGAGNIICTKYGCRPLPPHCHAETEFTWEGPTGYQFIVCP